MLKHQKYRKEGNVVNTIRNVSEAILDPPDGAICHLIAIKRTPSVPRGPEESLS